MGRLEGRIAIVTGAGRGIGRATAELFAAEGAKVIVASLSPGPGHDAVAAIQAAGGSAAFFPVDVSQREAIRDLVAFAVATYGGIDIVVHNAAHVPLGGLEELPEAELDKTFDAGLKAAFWLTRDALPHLRRSKAGRILVTSSVAARRGYIGMPHYSAVKAGLEGFVIGAALELARSGITVNAVAPGITLGDRLKGRSDQAAIDRMGSRIPIPRLSEPIEQARGFLYLASDDAAYVTGHVLAIDGGLPLGDADNPAYG